MSKTYYFEFFGTRDDFLKTLNQYPNNDHRIFYFNEYIVEIVKDQYYFGIERGGHSGGYWFKPTIIETDHTLLFSGNIEYIDSYTKNRKYDKITQWRAY